MKLKVIKVMNTTDKNKLIAEFMGGKPIFENAITEYWTPPKNSPEKQRVILFDAWRYHNSWEWLMPVVLEIEMKGKELSNISKYIHNHNTIFDLKLTEVTIETVYDYVIRFIEWYNEQFK